jgi:saccharopine dehydrogenase-like NADP-dependent oxidoreductase
VKIGMGTPLKQVLVAGGNGVTGRLIVQYLTKFKLPVQIDIAARTASHTQNLPEHVKKIDIDFQNREATSLLFHQYDIIILSVGPFDIFKASLHEICVSEQKICIDINDSFEATKEIYKLKKEAESNQSMILTGMGLAPGLTTLLLLEVLKRDNDTAKRSGVRIFFSDGINSGKASIYAMLINFISHVFILTNGRARKTLSEKIEKDSYYTFNESQRHKSLIFYSSPEIQTLPLNIDCSEIHQLDFAFHLEGMPMKMIPFLRGLKIFRKRIILFLCNSTYKRQRRTGSGKKTETQVIASAFGEFDNYTKCCQVFSKSSYELTALTASLIAEMAIKGEIVKTSGVYSIESDVISKQILKARFERQGIRIIPKIENQK